LGEEIVDCWSLLPALGITHTSGRVSLSVDAIMRASAEQCLVGVKPKDIPGVGIGSLERKRGGRGDEIEEKVEADVDDKEEEEAKEKAKEEGEGRRAT
jgi:hypothetical protein